MKAKDLIDGLDDMIIEAEDQIYFYIDEAVDRNGLTRREAVSLVKMAMDRMHTRMLGQIIENNFNEEDGE